VGEAAGNRSKHSDSRRRGDGRLQTGAAGAPAFLKALGAGNRMARGARRAQRPPIGGAGWKRQPLRGGPC
jgi:hypothetical protein